MTISNDKYFIEAQDIINESFYNNTIKFGAIHQFRRVISAGFPQAEQTIASEDLNTIITMTLLPEYRNLYFRTDKIVSENRHLEVAKIITSTALNNAKNTTDAASLIFSHAILDATLYDYCRACSIIGIENWTDIIRKKQVTIEDLQESNKENIIRTKVYKFVEQLERESLLKKADILYQVCRPDENFIKSSSFKYSREKVEQIDSMRHELVHGLKFTFDLKNVGTDIDYLSRTSIYFFTMVNNKYNLKIDPNFLFRTKKV